MNEREEGNGVEGEEAVSVRRGSLFLFFSAPGKGVPAFYLFSLCLFAC